MSKPEDEVRRHSPDDAEDEVVAKRKSFLELSLKLRQKTKGRVRIPSEILIREDRERGYRDV